MAHLVLSKKPSGPWEKHQVRRLPVIDGHDLDRIPTQALVAWNYRTKQRQAHISEDQGTEKTDCGFFASKTGYSEDAKQGRDKGEFSWQPVSILM